MGTRQPTSEPTRQPTSEPTRQPTSEPVSSPVIPPSKIPDPECSPTEKVLKVEVKTDTTSSENKLNVKQRNKKKKFKKKIIVVKTFENSKINTFLACVKTESKCYKMKITDKGKNGIQQGFVKMYLDDTKIYRNKFKRGKQRNKEFGQC